MAFRYVLEPNSGDSHQVAPYWLGLVVPFYYRVTADRQRILNQDSTYRQDISFYDIDGMKEGEKILLEHEVVQWSVSHSKANPQGTLALSLVNTGVDWRMKMVGGDWILFWAFENREDYLRIRNILRQVKGSTEALAALDKNACNGFKDGLKFVGRINSVRRFRRRRGDSGVVSSTYSITAMSFKEVNYQVHFNPAFRGAYGENNLQFQLDFSGFNDFVLAGSQGAIPAGKAVAALLNICLGRGAGEKWKFGLVPQSPGENQIATASPTGGVRIAVPTTVGAVLKGNRQNVGYNFVDISHAFVGLQRYSNNSLVRRRGEEREADGFDLSGMIPELDSDNFLEGLYVSQTLDFNQTTVWNILRTYLNAPINEMYTTLHVGVDGYVRPTIVARQVPFSSRLMDKVNYSTEVGPNKIKSEQTTFTDLPRWVVSPALVESEDLGTSDGMRFNYIHLPAHDITLASSSSFQNDNALYVLAPPFVDSKDIERNGLSMYTASLNTNMNVVNFDKISHAPAGYWTRLMADFITTQHLRFSGTLRLAGVQEPICVGDNVEYDGGLYHIEQIIHSGAIQGVGFRSFTTELQLSNGISLASDIDETGDNVYMVETPEVVLDDDRPIRKFGMGGDRYVASGGTQHESPKDKAPDNADAVGFRVYDGVNVDMPED